MAHAFVPWGLIRNLGMIGNYLKGGELWSTKDLFNKDIIFDENLDKLQDAFEFDENDLTGARAESEPQDVAPAAARDDGGTGQRNREGTQRTSEESAVDIG